jgi:hypothetical protein
MLSFGAACSPAAAPPQPTETLIPTLTPTQTPTVIWFPPTPTYTPFPTEAVTPTPALRTGIGEILLRDTFDDPGLWELPSTAAGVASFANGALSIALIEERSFLFSTRNGPELQDFYAEITARTSLCRGLDEYGLMVRVTGTLDYYRYSLSCDGQIRLDRIFGGAAAGLEPWRQSGVVPRGAPGIVRLGVWAAGEEMRFFADDVYQFTVNDPLIPAGSLGVFARSAGDSAVTVSFSDLEVWEVEP